MPTLTSWRALLNETDRNAAVEKNNRRASRRLDRLVGMTRRQLLAANRKDEPGAKPISSVEAAVCIARLDQILTRPRRGPRSVSVAKA